MNTAREKRAKNLVIGIVIGWALCSAYTHFLPAPNVPEEQQYLGMRQCAQDMNCQMTMADWERYYELKYRLERSQGK